MVSGGGATPPTPLTRPRPDAAALATALPTARITPRPWLLAVLRGAVAPGSSLAYVADTLLPLARTLQRASVAATERRSALEASQYHTLAVQTWALLPGFCAAPADLPSVTAAWGGNSASVPQRVVSF